MSHTPSDLNKTSLVDVGPKESKYLHLLKFKYMIISKRTQVHKNTALKKIVACSKDVGGETSAYKGLGQSSPRPCLLLLVFPWADFFHSSASLPG